MDTEKEFEELTGTGLDIDDAATVTEVEDDVVDDELPAVIDPLAEESIDDGSFGGAEASDEEEVHNLIYDELYSDQN